jgi:hypothetical protein
MATTIPDEQTDTVQLALRRYTATRLTSMPTTCTSPPALHRAALG